MAVAYAAPFPPEPHVAPLIRQPPPSPGRTAVLKDPPFVIARLDGEPLEEDEESRAATEGWAHEVAEHHARNHPGIKYGVFLLVHRVERSGK